MSLEAFVIHLARAAARRPQVDRLRAMLPMPVTVLDAVDGETLPDDLVAQVYQQQLRSPRYPF